MCTCLFRFSIFHFEHLSLAKIGHILMKNMALFKRKLLKVKGKGPKTVDKITNFFNKHESQFHGSVIALAILTNSQ